MVRADVLRNQISCSLVSIDGLFLSAFPNSFTSAYLSMANGLLILHPSTFDMHTVLLLQNAHLHSAKTDMAAYQ